MSLTNPNKPDDFSFAQCAEDYFLLEGNIKIPQKVTYISTASCGFMYEYMTSLEDFTSLDGKMFPPELNETITMFLLINAAIEGEI